MSLKSKSSELNHMFIVEKDIIKEVGSDREISRCKDPDSGSGFEEGGVKEVVGGSDVRWRLSREVVPPLRQGQSVVGLWGANRKDEMDIEGKVDEEGVI